MRWNFPHDRVGKEGVAYAFRLIAEFECRLLCDQHDGLEAAAGRPALAEPEGPRPLLSRGPQARARRSAQRR